jgi:hypothetical protein
MEVVRERPWSTVWRDGTRWVKRCPPHEVALTAALAARWPDRVVEVIEAHGDTLLLADAGVEADDPWLEILPLYAELQQGETAQPLRDAYLEVWGREYGDELDAALQVAAFTRILSWQRIDPTSPSLEANIEWFLEHVASS